jgi:hypothetical protein
LLDPGEKQPYIPLKRQEEPTKQYSITSWKTEILSYTAVKTSQLANNYCTFCDEASCGITVKWWNVTDDL